MRNSSGSSGNSISRLNPALRFLGAAYFIPVAGEWSRWAGSGEGVHEEAAVKGSDLHAALQFCRRHMTVLATISMLLLMPCVWHQEIVSSDLGSHVYNAWLAQLIARGSLPGLAIAPQYTNVLFDLLLSGLASVLGLEAAEGIAVSFAVLLFAWGLFALVASVGRRPPWLLLPCIALTSYGWTFHIGFFNYYLSLGISFVCLALWWNAQGWQMLAPALLAPLMLVAHPIGFFWFCGAAFFRKVVTLLPRRYGWAPFVAAALGLIAIHYYALAHYAVDLSAARLDANNGLDQLILFGDRYHLVTTSLFAFTALALTVDMVQRWRQGTLWSLYAVPLQLYVLAELAVFLLPDAVYLPSPAPLSFVTARLTLISAALGCCLLGLVRLNRWHLAASSVIALVFFSFLYQDTASINEMEVQAEALVSRLPPNQRVMATILQSPESRILIQHIIDRACIGHCFSYGNYEPSSGAFRIRATAANPYVLSDFSSVVAVENGRYVVREEDMPVYQVYQCADNGRRLCIRSLKVGEENDRLGVHPR